MQDSCANTFCCCCRATLVGNRVIVMGGMGSRLWSCKEVSSKFLLIASQMPPRVLCLRKYQEALGKAFPWKKSPTRKRELVFGIMLHQYRQMRRDFHNLAGV